MQLEKLDLLEKRLGRLVERYAELKEENRLLRQSLDDQAARLKGLEGEAGLFRAEREQLKNKLERIIGLVEQLEQLQDEEAGDPD